VSVKRPPRRYLGLRYAPETASRREVGAAIEAAWKGNGDGGIAPRLLVCQAGAAIIVVGRGQEAAARGALATAAKPGAPSLTPVVTSGTIATVKERLAVKTPRR
jgi:RNase P/RNase MRP subunit POP5